MTTVLYLVVALGLLGELGHVNILLTGIVGHRSKRRGECAFSGLIQPCAARGGSIQNFQPTPLRPFSEIEQLAVPRLGVSGRRKSEQRRITRRTVYDLFVTDASHRAPCCSGCRQKSGQRSRRPCTEHTVSEPSLVQPVTRLAVPWSSDLRCPSYGSQRWGSARKNVGCECSTARSSRVQAKPR
jgi:hypothetical protein